MGRKDKRYSKSLHEQMYDRLTAMQAFGESKRNDRANGDNQDKIYSFSTYKAYKKHCQYFIDWLHLEHPQVTTLKQARAYYTEWLESRCNLSAYTVHLETSALNKLFGITKDDPGRFIPPVRHRSEIKRSRLAVKRDKHFSESNNAELIQFCKATGLRREGINKIRGRDLVTIDKIEGLVDSILQIPATERNAAQIKALAICQDALLFSNHQYFIVVTEKGGKTRISPIIGPYTDQVVERFRNTKPEEKVWLHVSSNADIHSYRGFYAKQIYREYARPIEDIPYDRVNKGSGYKYQGDVYVCRKDSRARYDARALLLCSKSLGHSRKDVVARNYIYGL